MAKIDKSYILIMAGIDKTYVSSFKEYDEIREWSKHTYVKYLNGLVDKEPLYNWLYYPHLEEKDFEDNNEYVLWNTSQAVDIFLARNCPFKLIQNRLHEQYRNSYNDLLTCKSPNIEYSNHFKFIGSLKTLNWLNRYCDCWELQIQGIDWGVSYLTNSFVRYDEYLPMNSDELFIRNLNKRSLKRKLKKLPKGVTIEIINHKFNYYSFKLKVK